MEIAKMIGNAGSDPIYEQEWNGLIFRYRDSGKNEDGGKNLIVEFDGRLYTFFNHHGMIENCFSMIVNDEADDDAHKCDMKDLWNNLI